MSDYFPPAVSREGMNFEAEHALRDVQAAALEYGTEVKFYTPTESTVNRGRYNSVKSMAIDVDITVYANQVDYSPSKKTLERVGLSEDTEIIVYIPTQEFTDVTHDIKSIDLIRWRMVVKGREYIMSDKKSWSEIGDTYLYIVIGGKVK